MTNDGDSSSPTPHKMMNAPMYIILLKEERRMQTDNDRVSGITNCERVDCATPETCGLEKMIRTPLRPLRRPMSAKLFLYDHDRAAGKMVP